MNPDVVAGRYELGDVIGVGSAAVVHRALDRDTGAVVAVKRYRADATPADLRQQRREMTALSLLRHPGLVALLDGGTETGGDRRTFLVTDLVDGPTLATLLGDAPLLPEEVRELGVQLGAALAYVHAQGFVHRDVKPANVLIGPDGRPRLADFGIARTLDSTVATAAGRIVGTAAYLSPEQVRGEDVAPPVDVYALGLVLLECLTRRREYPGTSAESLVARLHRRPVVPDGLGWGLTGVLAAMTAPDPADRPSAAAVATALAEAAAGDRTADLSPGAAARTRARRMAQRPTRAGADPDSRLVGRLRRARWAVAGAAAGILVAVPVTGLLVSGLGAAPPPAAASPAATASPAPAAPPAVVPAGSAGAVRPAADTGAAPAAGAADAPAAVAAAGGAAAVAEPVVLRASSPAAGTPAAPTAPAAPAAAAGSQPAGTGSTASGNGNGNSSGNGNGKGKANGNGKANGKANGNGNGKAKGKTKG